MTAFTRVVPALRIFQIEKAMAVIDLFYNPIIFSETIDAKLAGVEPASAESSNNDR